ncbi:hypothetical protein ULG90_22150 [Halopseudomonas pachastrellae]|nr:hypothetical protein ULG90_22150 [Halopseudomonas pachastrellae]
MKALLGSVEDASRVSKASSLVRLTMANLAGWEAFSGRPEVKL